MVAETEARHTLLASQQSVCDAALAGCKTFETLFSTFCTFLQQQTGATSAYIGQVDPSGDSLRYVGATEDNQFLLDWINTCYRRVKV